MSKDEFELAMKCIEITKTMLNDTDSFGTTLLMRACGEGRLDLVMRIVDCCTCEQLDLCDEIGGNALTHAWFCQKLDVYDFVKSRGVTSIELTSDMRLLYAAYFGDLEELRKATRDNISLEVVDGQGRTPLLLAINSKNMNAIELLVGKGSQLHIVDKEQSTTLQYAARTGIFSIFQYILNLLNNDISNEDDIMEIFTEFANSNCIEGVMWTFDHGVTIESRSRRGGHSPLMIASESGHVDILRYILAKKPDLKEVDRFARNTAFLNAAFAGSLDCMKLLLEHGSRIDEKNQSKESAVSIVSQRGHTECLQFLIEQGANVNEKGHYDRTPLMHACENNHVETAELLIKHGASLKATDKDGHTPLLSALQKKRSGQILTLLLDNGANTEEKNKNGSTGLCIAADTSNVEAVKLFLERGAKIDARDSSGRTPLILAAGRGCYHCVSVLLDHGANINASNKEGLTALINAASNSKYQALKVLVERGADIEAKNKEGFTAYAKLIANSLYTMGGYVDCLKVLAEHGADLTIKFKNDVTLLMFAAQRVKLDTSILHQIIDKNLDLETKDAYSRTALIHAFKNGNLEAIKILASRGASCDTRDKEGNTPLLSIASSDSEFALQQLENLLNCGASIDAIHEETGQTPLLVALSQQLLAPAKILLARGASVTIRDKDGKSAIDYAFNEELQEIIRSKLVI